jgi:hypothetical protein
VANAIIIINKYAIAFKNISTAGDTGAVPPVIWTAFVSVVILELCVRLSARYDIYPERKPPTMYFNPSAKGLPKAYINCAGSNNNGKKYLAVKNIGKRITADNTAPSQDKYP